jgi:hypothetical protein
MRWTVIFAKNAQEAKEVAKSKRLGYWQYQYIGFPALLDGLKPEFTDIVFAPNWGENENSTALFEKAFGLGLIKGGEHA